MGEIQRTSSFLNFNTVILIVIGAAIGLLMGLAFYFDWLYLLAIPLILAVLYIAIYHIDLLFLAIVFFTPLSINIEEHTDQFGLFIPTEPLLFGIMILLVFYQFKSMLRLPILKTYKLFIGGQFLRTESGRFYQLKNKKK